MDVIRFLKNLKSQVGRGNTNSAITDLIEVLEGTAFINDAIQQSARLEELKNNERNGIVSKRELATERNDITRSLLSLIDKLEQEYRNEDKFRNSVLLALSNKKESITEREQGVEKQSQLEHSSEKNYTDTRNPVHKSKTVQQEKIDEPGEVRKKSNDNKHFLKNVISWGTIFFFALAFIGYIFGRPHFLPKDGCLTVAVLDTLGNPLQGVEVRWSLNNVPNTAITNTEGLIDLDFAYEKAEVGQELTLLTIDPSGRFKRKQISLITMQGSWSESIILEEIKKDNVKSAFVNFKDELNYLIQQKLVIVARMGNSEKRHILKNGAILLEYPNDYFKKGGTIFLFLEKNKFYYYDSDSDILIDNSNIQESMTVKLAELSDPKKLISKHLNEKIISDTNKSQVITTRIYDNYRRRLNFLDGLKVDVYVNNLDLNTKRGDFRVVAFYGNDKPKLVLNEKGYKVGNKPLNFIYDGRVLSFSVLKIGRKFIFYNKIAHLNLTNHGILD